MPRPNPETISRSNPPEFIEFLWGKITYTFGGTWEFLVANFGLILLGLVILTVLGYGLYRLHKKQKYVQKLWLFILFFLTKRQMVIPLIYTLAKRDKKLDNKILDELLLIREECRNVSLKKSPKKRVALEEKISQAIFDYFSALEKSGHILEESKFDHIIRDLEFMDKKLVDLQTLYNQEVKKWNKLVEIPILKYIFWSLFLRAQEKFGI